MFVVKVAHDLFGVGGRAVFAVDQQRHLAFRREQGGRGRDDVVGWREMVIGAKLAEGAIDGLEQEVGW